MAESSRSNYKKLNIIVTKTENRQKYYQIEVQDFLHTFVDSSLHKLFTQVGAHMLSQYGKGNITCWVTGSCRYVLFMLSEDWIMKLQADCIAFLNADSKVLGPEPLKYGGYVHEAGRAQKAHRPLNHKYEIQKGFEQGYRTMISMVFNHVIEERMKKRD